MNFKELVSKAPTLSEYDKYRRKIDKDLVDFRERSISCLKDGISEAYGFQASDQALQDALNKQASQHMANITGVTTGRFQGAQSNQGNIPKAPIEIREAYKSGPWIVHLKPKRGRTGFQCAYVCKHCMAIGSRTFKTAICHLCGYTGKEKITASWSNMTKKWEPRTNV